MEPVPLPKGSMKFISSKFAIIEKSGRRDTHGWRVGQPMRHAEPAGFRDRRVAHATPRALLIVSANRLMARSYRLAAFACRIDTSCAARRSAGAWRRWIAIRRIARCAAARVHRRHRAAA
ncbi:hypothetical protein [Burkholderia latens]|uniref:hypothetical protein n=1 Tax=Burkholderia latens TaxID=488446 RepID=UPI00158ED989|nr:hypothetical protein [Burkholderia latens]